MPTAEHDHTRIPITSVNLARGLKENQILRTLSSEPARHGAARRRKKSNERFSLSWSPSDCDSWVPTKELLFLFSFEGLSRYPSHILPLLRHRLHSGFASSHFTRRDLHVRHPDRDFLLPSRPFFLRERASWRFAAALARQVSSALAI